MKSIDLFAGGAGGWDLAARELGWPDPDGAEYDDNARQTRRAAGLSTRYKDVRDIADADGYDLLCGGPPCTRFSKAGNSPAHRHLVAVCHAIRSSVSTTELATRIGDPVAALVVEPLRLIERSRPTFVALEQTPTVLPVWKEYADRMRWWGYSVATGIVSAAWYGTPQTRKRAILLARRDGERAMLPVPTHTTPVPMSSVIDRDPGLWVQRSNYSAPAGEGRRTAAERGRTVRSLRGPSVTITRKAFGWMDTYGHVEPCSVRDQAVLQDFPADHPWQGGVSAARLQIGNAIPVRLAVALLRAVTDSVDLEA